MLIGADCSSPEKPGCAPESHFISSNRFLPHRSPHQRCRGVRQCTLKQHRSATGTDTHPLPQCQPEPLPGVCTIQADSLPPPPPKRPWPPWVPGRATGVVSKASPRCDGMWGEVRFQISRGSDGLGKCLEPKPLIFCYPRCVNCTEEPLSGQNRPVLLFLALSWCEHVSGRKVSAVS